MNVVFRLLACLAFCAAGITPAAAKDWSGKDRILERAWLVHLSGFQTKLHGTVIAILPDDNDGSRHQRFIVKLASGQTILIAHNIDLAPRVKRLREGSVITAKGEYIWNEQGGIVHYTHLSPFGTHPGGWIQFNGKRFR